MDGSKVVDSPTCHQVLELQTRTIERQVQRERGHPRCGSCGHDDHRSSSSNDGNRSDPRLVFAIVELHADGAVEDSTPLGVVKLKTSRCSVLACVPSLES